MVVKKRKILTEEVVGRIKYYLKENKTKKIKRLGKQQKRKVDIYEALISDGIQIGYITVAQGVNAIERKGRGAYIKQEYWLGECCEFDWGTVKLYTDNNILREYQMAVFTTSHDNYRYARLFPKQNTNCFLESHALLKLSLYYGFNFRFCNAYLGNEKAPVERNVDYIRHKAFCDKDSFQSLEEANAYLESICDNLNNKSQPSYSNKSALQMFNEEKEYILPRMSIYEVDEIIDLRVDKYSTIAIDTCHYSVSDKYINCLVRIKKYSNKIICFYNNKKIAEHVWMVKRCCLLMCHYL